jgi:hypothetical protein
MYSINGIPLDNPGFGWSLRSPTQPLSSVTRERPSLQQAGRDGVVPGLGSTARPVTIPFVVATPRSQLETLLALFGAGGTLSQSGDASREVQFETLSSTPVGYGDADWLVNVTFQLRLPRVFWRDKDSTTHPAAALTSSSVELSCFDGLSSPIQDAVLRLKGAADGIQITDASGAWVTLPAAAADAWIRFESSTGRAFATTADSWSGGSDVSGHVDFGGPRGLFEITPALDPLDPSVRRGRLTVTTVSRANASFEVRGRSAYIL